MKNKEDKSSVKKGKTVKIEIPSQLWEAIKRQQRENNIDEDPYTEIIYTLTNSVLSWEESAGRMSRLYEAEVNPWLKKLGVEKIINFDFF